jgi:hypothetical protein
VPVMLGCLVSSSCSCILAFHAFSFLISLSYHVQIWHDANICIHSCILVTETLENEPVEPTEIIEPEPSVEFVIESKENQGKQISIIFFPRLN